MLPFFGAVCVAQTAPTISAHPQSQYVNAGSSVTLSVTATASSALTYQWKFNGQNLIGATTSSFTINTIQPSQDGQYSVVVTAGGVSVTSNTALVTVLVPPAITTQPLSKGVIRGGSLSLYVNVSGSNPMTYAWKKDNVAISGATSYYYDKYSVANSDAGTYTVTITNAAGSVTSNSAVVTVVDPISITTQPMSQTVDVGANVTMTVAATGPGTLAYQWAKNGNTISGATGTTLSLNNVTAASSGSYTCYVTNEYQTSWYGVTSSPAVLTVKSAPVFTTQPAATRSVSEGNSLSLWVEVAGAGPVTYQWKKDGAALTNGSRFSGTTSYNLSVWSMTTAEAGNYTVDATNAYGTTTSTVSAVTVTSNPNFPVITEQPAGQAGVVGGTASFAVTATTPTWTTLSYQWRKDGVSISGQIARTLTLSNLTLSDAASYSVVVTNSYGSVTSANATLSVTSGLAAPSFTQQPSSVSLFAGETATFSVVASGNPAPAYQWRKDGVAISGATSSTLTLNNTQPADAGVYSVVATNSQGTATSADASLSVTSKTRIVNLSSRAQVNTDAEILISGFVINGSTPKRMLIRAVGPTLSKLGVDGVLANPFLRIMSSNGELLASNDDWGVSSNLQELTQVQAQTGAFALQADSKDAAILTTLQPGAYTALVTGIGGTGVALAEVYEVDDTTANHLINISARAYVSTGSKVLIAGIVVRGSGSKRFVIRGIGPGLAQFNVPGLLANPKIELMDSDGKAIAVNDDWAVSGNLQELKSAMTAVGAFTIQPDSKDAALLVTLQPGIYTAIISGVGNTSGVGLVEVYQAP